MNSFDFFDKKYVLTSNSDRLASVSEQFENIGIDVDVYTGEEVSTNVLYNIYKYKYDMIKMSKDASAANVLIFEDDVTFTEDSISILKNCVSNLPEDWDVFYLFGFPNIAYSTVYENDKITTTMFGKELVIKIDNETNFPIDPISNKLIDPSTNTCIDGTAASLKFTTNVKGNYVLDETLDADSVVNSGCFTKFSDNLYKVNKGGFVGFMQAVAFNARIFDTILEHFENVADKNYDIELLLCELQRNGKINTFYAVPNVVKEQPGISIIQKRFVEKDPINSPLYNILLNL